MPEPSSSAGSASTTKPTPPDGAPCQRARAGTLRGSPCQAASRLLRFAAPLRVTRRPAQRRVCRWPEAGFRPPATRNPHPALTPAQTQTTVTNFTAFPTRNPSSEACAFRLISLLEWTFHHCLARLDAPCARGGRDAIPPAELPGSRWAFAAFEYVAVDLLAVHQVVHHRDDHQGQQGGDQEAADYGNGHGGAEFGGFAEADGHGE